MLTQYEQNGWWLQLKLNGTNSLIRRDAKGNVTTWTRHGEAHKAWPGFSKAALECLRSLPGGDIVFNGELLFSKTPTVREQYPEGVHYLYDVLVYNGEYLLGETYAKRYFILEGLCGGKPVRGGQRIINRWFWLAQNCSNFADTFARLNKPECEGVVVKDPEGILQFKKSEWMAKCRREGHTNRFIKN